MRFRKLTVILLALLLLVSLIPAACATDTSMSFAFILTGSGSGLKAGDTFDVSFTLTRIDKAESWQMYAWQTEIAFDNSAFELVEGSIKAAEGVGSSYHVGALENKVYFNDFSFSAAGDEYPASLEAGSFTLRVKDSGKGAYAVRNTNYLVSTKGGADSYSCGTRDLTVTLPGSGKSASEIFTDVPSGAWFEDAVDFVVRRGLFNGTGEDTFSPADGMTRAMLVTVLWRLEGKPQVSAENRFTDVPSGTWFTDAVRWANAQGIVTGYDEKTFGPNDLVTRQQIAAILYRYASARGYASAEPASLTEYTDRGEIASWAFPAMRWANAAGLITGRTADTLAPNGTANRAEVATIFMRLCESIISGGTK